MNSAFGVSFGTLVVSDTLITAMAIKTANGFCAQSYEIDKNLWKLH